MTLKYGLIGAGMMGQEHIRNIALLHDVEVAAICEPNTDMANAARQLAPNAPERRWQGRSLQGR